MKTDDSHGWSAQDERRLMRCCAAAMTVTQLAIRLDRGEAEIVTKLRELGLRAPPYRSPPRSQL